jgi:hypothetical protein
MQGGEGGLTRLARFLLTEADVTARPWRFGPEGRGDYAHHLRLLPGGRVGFYQVDAERGWRIRDGKLSLLDALDRPTTEFDQTFVDAEGRLVLVGAPLRAPPGSPAHVLREIDPLDALHPPGLKFETVRRTPSYKRPYLLLLNGDESSLHPEWPRDIADEDRTWDFVLSFYGRHENFGKDPHADIQIAGGGHKFLRLHALFHRDSPLWRYERIAFCDDDLMLRWSDVNRLFAVHREFDLQLAQPSLTRDSHIAHAVTAHQPDWRLRFTSFVESMFPVWRRDALLACMPTFGQAAFGHGVDNIWPKLLGEPQTGLAVIDEVQVKHTRPTGMHYDVERTIQEGLALQHRYNAPSRVLEYGGVRREGRDMQWWALEARGETI